MITSTKKNLEELFSDILFFLISRWFSEIKTNAIRPFYKGCFKLGSKKEFNRLLSIGFNDLIKKSNIESNKWLDSI